MNLLAVNRLSLIALLVLVTLTLFLYGQLPNEFTTGFTEIGEEPDVLSKSIAALLIQGGFVLMLILCNIIIALSPEKFALPQSKRAMDSDAS